MKVGISGPPGAGKTQLLNKIKDNSWLKKHKITITPSPSEKHLANEDLHDHELVIVQSFILNDHISNLLFTSNNVITDTTMLDTLVKMLQLSRKNLCPVNVFDSYINNVCKNLSQYDIIFLLIPEDDEVSKQEYNDIIHLVTPFIKKLVILDPLQDKRHADIIILDVQEEHKRKIESNEKNSNQWFTVYGEDYASKLSQNPPGV